MNPVLRDRLAKLAELQGCLETQPYSIILRLKLATAYKNLGYPDLAVGDAYKALLLVDEVSEEGEFHEEALNAAEEDFSSVQFPQYTAEDPRSFSSLSLQESGTESSDTKEDNESEVMRQAKNCWSKIAYEYGPFPSLPKR